MLIVLNNKFYVLDETSCTRIEAVSKAASEMETVTQMMASNSEQTAAASEELSAQSEELKFFVNDLLTIIYGNTRKN